MNAKELVSNSIDARCCRNNIRILLIVFVICDVFASALVLYLFWNRPSELTKALIWCNSLFVIAYLPMTIFYAIKLRSLVNKSDTFIFSESQLKEYSVGFGGHICFIVEVIDASGNIVKRNTESVFTMRGTIARFDEWKNKSVNVAYDPKSEKVIICSAL